MILLYPIWLILIIPLAVAWWNWKFPTRLLQGLRAGISLLILLSLCGLALKLPSQAGTVVIVADRSLSMPLETEAVQKEAIDLIQAARRANDQVAVVSFGQKSAVEQLPQGGRFGGFVTELGKDASNLNDGLEKALSLIPPDSPGKIVVLSDGKWTGKNPANAAAIAASRNVAIDYRAISRTSANDVAITQLDAPARVAPGEAFMLTVWVESPTPQELTFELMNGAQVIGSGKREVSSGLNRLTFRDIAKEPGTQNYTVRVQGATQDPIPENNAARVLVGVEGAKPLLCVTQNPASAYAQLLKSGGLNMKVLTPSECSWQLEELAKYSAVLLENVPAQDIGLNGMENLAAWVKESGAGLMMTGGKNAFGPGGYFQSPIDPILPVSMELRREHRKLTLAIVVTMDRSGSMAAPAGGGRIKMDLANLGAVQVYDLLSPFDEFGVIAVDSSPHTIAELGPVDKTSRVRNDILRVDSQGGGIFIYEALSASANMLLKAKAGTRHIILFADAADSEEPGKYQDLLDQCKQANITVSVIGLGKPSDVDAKLLEDIAKRGNGRIYFTENADDLPRLFAQDTFVVARSTFLEDPTTVKFTGGMVSVTGKQFPGTQLGGYNLCYLRPGATLGSVTVDQYQAPIVATWQAGIGRVVAYTGEADGKFTGAIAGWPNVGDMFSSLARWAAGSTDQLANNMLVTQEIKNGVGTVQLHLDPDRESEGFRDAPNVTTLRGKLGSKAEVEKSPLQWVDADTLALEIPLQGTETTLSTVDIAGIGKVTLPPVVLPYSPEFRPIASVEGITVLEQLAKATGGTERLDLTSVWKDLPKRPRLIDLTPWLLMATILLLLIEVLERRTRLVSAQWASLKIGKFHWPKFERLRTPKPKTQISQPGVVPAHVAPSATPAAPQPSTSVPKFDPKPDPTGPSSLPTDQKDKTAMVEALRKARQQVRGRQGDTGKK